MPAVPREAPAAACPAADANDFLRHVILIVSGNVEPRPSATFRMGIASRHAMKGTLARFLLAAWCGFAVGAGAAPAAPPAEMTQSVASTPSGARWTTAFAAFDADDAAHPPAPGGVLFVGSSSIRLWSNLEGQFANLPVVINRGFGGSQLSDCVRNLSRLVLPYRPRAVLVYAGDNDLAAGVSAKDVLRRFTAFVDGVHAELPWTKIVYISIKPSPARLRLLPEIRQANELIRDYAASVDGVEYADVFNAMLDGNGKPRGDLFRADRLHLNSDGYALWKGVIAPYVY
jgi:lysophospholipase L1-like esterase